jgi:rhamnogalacturonan endolyase
MTPPRTSPEPQPEYQPRPLGRREFLARAGVGGIVIGLGAVAAGELAPAASAAVGAVASPAAPAAAAATAFGYTSSGGLYTVSTGAGLTFVINQSTGGMTSLNINGTELQPTGTNESHVESGLPSPTVSAQQTGDYIIITASTTTWYGSGTLHHYYVAVSGQNNIYMATYVGSAGEVRWIQYLNRSILTNIITASDVDGGTAIESTDIDLVDGQTRSKYYSNRQAMSLTPRGATGSGIGVYMAYGTRESSAGGPFFRDIEQQGTSASVEVYNYMWSAHNQTEAQRLGVLYGPYALMVAGTSAPASPDMSFMYTLGFDGAYGPSERGYVVGAAAGLTSGTTGTVGFSNVDAQYWCATGTNGDFSSPAMKPGEYLQTLYQDELAVATQYVTVTAGSTLTGQNITSTWVTPASPIFRIGTWTGAPTGFLNWANLTSMHPSDARMASWGPVTYTVGSSSAGEFPAYQFKDVNNPTTVKFTLTSSQIAARTVRIGITAAYAGGRPQITVNSWTSAAPAPSTQPDSRSLTIGTYRGNNTLYTYAVPASAFVTGTNTMTITSISGSAALSDWLSPAFSYDCVEMY